jgi:hypothetical protein
MERRSLDLHDADAVIDEIRRLRDDGYDRLGKWNLAQICEHLTSTMRIALEPVGRRMPRPIRALVFTPLMRRVVRTRRMKAGLPTIKPLLPTCPTGPDDSASINDCITMLERARDISDTPIQHPAIDLTNEEWQQLSWVHASHHLSFLLPREGRRGTDTDPATTSSRSA